MIFKFWQCLQKIYYIKIQVVSNRKLWIAILPKKINWVKLQKESTSLKDYKIIY